MSFYVNKRNGVVAVFKQPPEILFIGCSSFSQSNHLVKRHVLNAMAPCFIKGYLLRKMFSPKGLARLMKYFYHRLFQSFTALKRKYFLGLELSPWRYPHPKVVTARTVALANPRCMGPPAAAGTRQFWAS
jgi:hypothetical protein